jgi:mono/diheme cytochrome c family protein
MSARYEIVALVLACCAAASASAQTSADRGKAKFEHSCAPCHGKGVGNDGHAQLPGTEALKIKYKGTIPAALEDRTDLNADTIRAFVRNGTFSMPPFRPTELTNAEIADIAAYIGVTAKRAGK